MKPKGRHFLIFLLLLVHCKEPQQTESKQESPALDTVIPKQEKVQPSYAIQSTSEQTAANLKNFFTQDFLKDDLSYLSDFERQFQFFEIDLNDDGKKEIFVRFFGPYFCGSGGCSFLLLDSYGEIITHFSVTRAPFFIEKVKKNGWSILLVKDAGVFKELTFKNGSYDNNPSLLEKAPYDAPSGHAIVVFDDENFPSKTFSF